MKKVVEGKITSGFGFRTDPITGAKGSYHNGVDVSCVVGSSVLSPCNGWVAEVRQNSAEGIAVILRDRDREMRFGFCHLSRALLKVGDPVSKGQTIALSGNTGRSTGPHLHFTAKDGGKWQGATYIGGDFRDAAKYLEIL